MKSNMESEMKERIRSISEKLTDSMGYIYAGGVQWGRRAIDKFDGINFDRVYSCIAEDYDYETVFEIIQSNSDRLISTYTQNDNKNDSIMEEFNVSRNVADIICAAMEETLKLDEVLHLVVRAKYNNDKSRSAVEGIQIDSCLIDFARSYNSSRTPVKDGAILSTKTLSVICSESEKVLASDIPEEDKDKVLMKLVGFLNKNVTHGKVRTMLVNECAKSILKFGEIPHESYREWADQAIAVSIMWRKNKRGIKHAINEVCDNIYYLSRFEDHPEDLMIRTISTVERAIERIEGADIPLGLSVREVFIEKQDHDERYFFNITARMSEACGRKKRSKKKHK